MKNTILKSMLALGIIAFALTLSQCSCGKPEGDVVSNNNSGNDSGNSTETDNEGSDENDGGSKSGRSAQNDSADETPTCTGICPSGKLVLSDNSGHPWIRVIGNVVIINAAGLAAETTPLSSADDDDRSFNDLDSDSSKNIFKISYPGGTSTANLFFVSRTHVTKDTIAFPAAVTEKAQCTGSETAENDAAELAGGGHCLVYSNDPSPLIQINTGIYSTVGTVFNNTNTNTHARGMIQCRNILVSVSQRTVNPISDTTLLNDFSAHAYCSLGVVNSAGGAAAAEIDNSWLADDTSVREVELYAIAINVSGKTIPEWSDAPGYGLSEFIKAHDNAALKRLLKTNPWADLKFKIRIYGLLNSI